MGILLLVGLWPFNFRPKNEVEFLKEKAGIRFYGRGIVYSPDPWIKAGKEFPIADSISLEIWIEPRTEQDHYFAHIFSLYDGVSSEDFILGQWKSFLILRSRLLNDDRPPGYREVDLPDVLHKGQSRLFTLISDQNGTTIYIDGKRRSTFPGYSLLDRRNGNQYLVLGNSSTGSFFWIGTLFGLAVYDRPLTADQVYQHYQFWMREQYQSLSKPGGLQVLYSFNERNSTTVHNQSGDRSDLLMPSTFHMLRKMVLILPWKDVRWTRHYLKDILLNVAGFVPLGFFMLLYLQLKNRPLFRASLAVVVIGTAISLFIELLQVYLPMRSSSLTDLMCNGLGTALGTFLGLPIPKSFFSSKT